MSRPCRSHAFESGQVADMVHESIILVGWDFIQVQVSNFKHLVELSPPWTAHARTGRRARFVRLHQSLLYLSPEMPIATRLK